MPVAQKLNFSLNLTLAETAKETYMRTERPRPSPEEQKHVRDTPPSFLLLSMPCLTVYSSTSPKPSTLQGLHEVPRFHEGIPRHPGLYCLQLFTTQSGIYLQLVE